VGAGFASQLLYAVYAAGPPLIALVAVAVSLYLLVTQHPWMALQAFTAFFLPVLLGSYSLMLFDVQLRRAFSQSQVLPWLLVPFLVVIFVGQFALHGSGDWRLVLFDGFMGLILATFLLAQLARGSHRSVRDWLDRRRAVGPAMHLAVGLVTAVGILVLVN
jgi:hypothetical protein